MPPEAVSASEVHERITAEEPGESGPLAVARRAKAGDESGAERRVRREPLVHADERPVEGAIETRVRRRHARPTSSSAGRSARCVPRYSAGNVAGHAFGGGSRRPRAVGRRRDDDRHELPSCPIGRDIDRELERHVARLLLIRHHRAIDAAGHADPRGESPARPRTTRRRAQSRPSRHSPSAPRRATSAAAPAGTNRGRSWAASVSMSSRMTIAPVRQSAQTRSARTVNAACDHGEDRRLGPYLDRARQLMRGHRERIPFEPEAELQVVENLERIHPDFERAPFVPERGAAPPDDVEERPGRQAALQGQTRCGERESRGHHVLRARPRCRRADDHEHSDESASHQGALESPLTRSMRIIARPSLCMVPARRVHVDAARFAAGMLQSLSAFVTVRNRLHGPRMAPRRPSHVGEPVFPERHVCAASARGTPSDSSVASVVACVMFALSVPSVHAQAVYGSISGTVRDNSGARSAGRDGHGHERGAQHHRFGGDERVGVLHQGPSPPGHLRGARRAVRASSRRVFLRVTVSVDTQTPVELQRSSSARSARRSR